MRNCHVHILAAPLVAEEEERGVGVCGAQLVVVLLNHDEGVLVLANKWASTVDGGCSQLVAGDLVIVAP